MSTQHATVVHELAHLYCGHLGTPDKRWWPSRTGLSHEEREFEPESIAYLVCRRNDPSVRFPPYQSNTVRQAKSRRSASNGCLS